MDFNKAVDIFEYKDRRIISPAVCVDCNTTIILERLTEYGLKHLSAKRKKENIEISFKDIEAAKKILGVILGKEKVENLNKKTLNHKIVIQIYKN